MIPVYKEDVIEALETEPLGWGGWAQVSDSLDYRKPIGDINCTVCAIGGVIRTLKPQTASDEIDWLARNITQDQYSSYCVANKNNWAGALSIFWENLRNEYIPVEEARVIAIDWVNKTFPRNEILFYL